MQIIFLIKRVVSDQKLIMKCIVCGTRMHYRNFFKVLKDENFLGWKNKKKPVTTENIKKTWNWDRQIIFWDNWITSITSITPITLITLITPITSITKKNQGPKLKANHKSHQSHQSHFWSELSHKEPLVTAGGGGGDKYLLWWNVRYYGNRRYIS